MSSTLLDIAEKASATSQTVPWKLPAGDAGAEPVVVEAGMGLPFEPGAAAEPKALWSCVLSSGQGAGRPGNCELLSLPHLTAYCSQAGSTKMRQLGDNPDQSNAASY